jgi:uroporphyrin-III C-methyltransferase/precorrin-2 dehydrogenase/sirohydrochlorin ferrochelatase
MSLLPIFLNLEGRRCLLVGAGAVALEKIGSLIKTGLHLRVVAPWAREEVRQLAADGKLEFIDRPFEPADLDGNYLVITATDAAEVNMAVYRAATERGILCNSVDDIPNCDFFFGSVINRGALQIAISTAGESPAVAQRLRHEIEAQLPADLGPWLENLGQLRREVLAIHPRSDERKVLLHQLASRSVCESASCPSRRMAYAPLAASEPEPDPGSDRPAPDGKIWLVGAGPGDPELLTIKALRLLQSANVVLHDDLVPQTILDLAPRAEVVNVGKRCGFKNITQEEINGLLVEHARQGRRVVRLKSGDPMIFGRAAEEIQALNNAGIAFEIVPGITAAFAAAAAIPCSLTDRHSASNVTFSTGHHAQSHNDAPVPALEDATRVVYMPGREFRLLAAEWLAEGLPGEFPCAVVSRAAQADQQVFRTTLAELGEAPPAQAPSLLLAGWALKESAVVEEHMSNATVRMS